MIDEPVLKMMAFTVSAVGLNACNPGSGPCPDVSDRRLGGGGHRCTSTLCGAGRVSGAVDDGVCEGYTGSYTIALLTLAAWVLISAGVAASFNYSTALERRPEKEEGEVPDLSRA